MRTVSVSRGNPMGYSTTPPCTAPFCGNPEHSEFEHWGGQLVCPTCGSTVREWIETANAIHCYQSGRGWKKHPKEKR